MRLRRTEHELRCTCANQPLLGIFGMDNGEAYIHVKVYKSKRIYAEVVFSVGRARIFCRECFRWNRITLRHDRPALEETPVPAPVGVND